jgi:cytosine/adenosine deaminase-related metal-dependent hydrolase
MMQTRLLLPLLILALVTPSAQAQRRNATLIINGGTLIDGTGAPPVSDAAVVVSGNRIAEAGPSSKIKVSKNTKTIDARGKWIIPGLIDAHVHFFQSSDLYTRPSNSHFGDLSWRVRPIESACISAVFESGRS